MVHARVVACALIETLHALDLSYPKVDKAKLEEIIEARKALSKSK